MIEAEGSFTPPAIAVRPRATAVIVFSKDRPLQLDATLRSGKLDLPDLDPASIHVLFTTSSPVYAAAYRVLANDHAGVDFVREAAFKADLVRLVAGSTHVLFLVDDTLFVAPASLTDAIDVLDGDPACLGFSFRLGRNTVYCYTLDAPQSLPDFDEGVSGHLTFDWTQAEHDFGYPLEVSSSLYRTADVLPLLRELDYRNPNTLESALAQQTGRFKASRPRLACLDRSVALSVPANLVQTAWKNRIDTDPGLTAEALGNACARGQRLDVPSYQGFVPNACHQEIEFRFVQDPSIPTVSIVIPCYRQAEYLPDAVASVVAQTFADWEIVIVDDGSPDDTAAVAAELIAGHPEHRIRVVRQDNLGLPGARNAGISISKGRYVLPLDADDAIEPTMLEKSVGLLDSDRSVAIAYTDLQQFGGGHELVRAAEFDPVRLPEANHLSYCSLYRREVWEATGGYDPGMIWGYEDWDVWVGASERGYRARRIAEPLFQYRIRAGSMYADALAHDAELRRRMRRNHPATYRPTRRLARWVRVVPGALVRRAARRLRRLGRAPDGVA
jgi:hypothetical protein